MSIREYVRNLVAGLTSGRVADTFDRFYAHNVMISENDAGVLVGKAANENYYTFVNGDLLAGARPLHITVRGNRSEITWALDRPTRTGTPARLFLTTDQTWNGGRVVRENYSYSVNDNHAPEPSVA